MTLIEIPSWKTVTLVEAIWLVSGLAVVLFCSFHIRPLYRDWQAVLEQPALRAIASGYLRREIIRLLQGLCITGIGAYASTQPPVVTGLAFISIVGIVITSALVGLALSIAVQSAWDWRTREEIQDLVNHDIPTENAILLVDAAGKVKYSNNVADKVFGRRLVGLQVEELVPKHLRVAHQEHRAEYAKNPTTRPMGLHLGTMGLRPDGSEFPIYATLSPFTDEAGETYTMVTAKLGEVE